MTTAILLQTPKPENKIKNTRQNTKIFAIISQKPKH
jgi:hypothetical protein